MYHFLLASTPLKKIDAAIFENGLGSFFYLGLDEEKILQFKKNLPIPFYSISETLTQTAFNLRKSYTEWSASFSEKYENNISWWTNSLWERNTPAHPLFTYLCYLGVIDTIHAQDTFFSKKILVLVESPSFYRLLIQHCVSHSITHKSLSPFRWKIIKKSLQDLFLVTAKFFMAVGNSISWKMASKRTKEVNAETLLPENSKPKVLLHTCVDQTCLKNNGEFSDRYFPGLAPILENKGFAVTTLIWPNAIQKKRKQFVEFFKAHPEKYILLEDFVHFSDYIWSFFILMRGAFLGPKKIKIEKYDLSSLLWSLRLNILAQFSLYRFVLYYKLIENLSRQGVVYERFIDMFENYGLEKPILMAFKKFSPQTELIGYQHAGGQPFNLRYMTTPEEFVLAPYPDVIITNGPLVHEKMVEDGFDSTRLQPGPALRFSSYFKNVENKTQTENAVLLALPLLRTVSEYMCSLVAQLDIFKLRKTKLIVKLHPMSDDRLVRKCLALLKKIGPEISKDPLETLISRAKAVIVTDGSSVVESLLKNKITLVLKKEATLSQHLFDWFTHMPHLHRFSNGVELEKLLTETTEIKEASLQKELLFQLYNPLEPHYYKSFL